MKEISKHDEFLLYNVYKISHMKCLFIDNSIFLTKIRISKIFPCSTYKMAHAL